MPGQMTPNGGEGGSRTLWRIIFELARIHLGRAEVPPAAVQEPVVEGTAQTTSEEPWEVPLQAEQGVEEPWYQVPVQGARPFVMVTPGDKYWVVVKAAPGKLKGVFNRYEHMRENVYDPLEVYCAGRREIKYAPGVQVKSFKYVKDADAYWSAETGTTVMRRF